MIDPHRLGHFIPLNGLRGDSLTDLAANLEPHRLASGERAFAAGDTDGDLIYLLEGRIALVSPGRAAERVITAGSEEARYALAKLTPRPYSGVARSPSTVIRIDAGLLDRMLTRDQTLAYEVVEYEGDDPEWMIRILSNHDFSRLPPAKLNGLFARLEEMPVHAGQTILRQGEEGDYYYLIKSGRARVVRETEGGDRVPLAELGPGEGFGEEALLSGAPRNATVSMLSDGILMRLAAGDFAELLQAPLVRYVNADEARQLQARGAGIIDVRLEGEYPRGTLRGSINIPLYLLRLQIRQLDPARPYVICCQTGSRSTVAAFLLSQRGLDAYVLQGGLDAANASAR